MSHRAGPRRAVLVAMLVPLVAGCITEFDRPLAPPGDSVPAPDLLGHWRWIPQQPGEDEDELWIEPADLPHVPGHLLTITTGSGRERETHHGWVTAAGGSRYLNILTADPREFATPEAFAAWSRRDEQPATIVRCAVSADTLTMFLMDEKAPAVARLFADGVLRWPAEPVDQAVAPVEPVLNRGLRERLEELDGREVFCAEETLDYTRVPVARP